MLLAFLDWTWNSTPWIMWPLVGLVAFVMVYLLLTALKRPQAQPGAAPAPFTPAAMFAPAPPVGGRLAPSANPFDVKHALEELASLAMLEGQTDIAVILSNLAAGDERESHRAIRELSVKYRSPRAITAAAKPVILRHLEDLRDDPDVKRILDRLKAVA